MGERIQLLIDAAKRLSPAEREELLEAILQLDGQFESRADDLAEWNRRADDARSNDLATVDAEQAIAEARAEIEQRRKT